MHLSPRTKRTFLFGCIFLWSSFSTAAYWYYQVRWSEQFPSSQQLAFFNGAECSKRLLKARAPDAITVIHLARKGCFCNRFNEPHGLAIKEKYLPLGVTFTTLELGVALELAAPSVALVNWFTLAPTATACFAQ